MIESYQDYKYYLEADRIAKSKPKQNSYATFVKDFITPDYVWKFQKILRKREYFNNCKKGFIYKPYKLYLKYRFKNLSIKLGFSIPINVFGPGLSIAHFGTIVVSGYAKIGANCRLHTCVNIGTEAGYTNKAPKIGDNCYIGPGSKIYGDVTIPDNCAIGANAVVNKSFSEAAVAIGGVPAKIISRELNTKRLLIPATEIIEKGINEFEISGISANKLYDDFLSRNTNGKQLF